MERRIGGSGPLPRHLPLQTELRKGSLDEGRQEKDVNKEWKEEDY